MKRAITKEDTFFRSKFKLVIVIGTQVRPISTTKIFKKGVIGCLAEKFLKWSLHIKNTSRKPVYEKTGSGKSITPKPKRNRAMS